MEDSTRPRRVRRTTVLVAGVAALTVLISPVATADPSGVDVAATVGAGSGTSGGLGTGSPTGLGVAAAADGGVLPVAPLPPARPVAADVEAERLTPATPSPGSAGAAQVTSTDPLKLVAVTWTGRAPDVVELRSRLASGAFGPWTRVDPVDTERDGRRAATSGTEPVWVDDSREVQVRATDAGAPATPRVALTSIDPGTSTNDVPIATGGAAGSPGSPRVVTRAQ